MFIWCLFLVLPLVIPQYQFDSTQQDTNVNLVCELSIQNIEMQVNRKRGGSITAGTAAETAPLVHLGWFLGINLLVQPFQTILRLKILRELSLNLLQMSLLSVWGGAGHRPVWSLSSYDMCRHKSTTKYGKTITRALRERIPPPRPGNPSLVWDTCLKCY